MLESSAATLTTQGVAAAAACTTHVLILSQGLKYIL